MYKLCSILYKTKEEQNHVKWFIAIYSSLLKFQGQFNGLEQRWDWNDFVGLIVDWGITSIL